MALPAGYSSEEDFSEDDGFFFPERERSSTRNNINPNNFFKPLGQKLLVALLQEKYDDAIKLIKDGADVNFRSKQDGGWTPLMRACSNGVPDIISLLLENGANVNDHHELITPLMCVCDCSSLNENRLIECIELLVQHGADINAVDWYNTSVLTYAVKRNHEKLIQKLISMGCKINVADSEGWTPLFYAVDAGRLNLVKILINEGANINILDRKSRSLYDIATNKYYQEIAKLVNTVEETDMELNIDDEIVYKGMSSYSFVLSELPNHKYGRFYGFHSDVIKWLKGIHLKHLTKSFIKENIQLGELLIANDEHLKNIGIIFSFDRKKILFFVQKLLEHNWGKESIKRPRANEEITLILIAQLICNIVRHIQIINAATYIWKNNSQMSSVIEKDIKKGLFHVNLLRKELHVILNVIKEIEEEENVTPADLILPKNRKNFSYKWILLSIPIGFIFLKSFNIRFNNIIQIYLKYFFLKISHLCEENRGIFSSCEKL